ncbi:DASH complex subunit Ask1-domain-containing protein [Lactarius deliciosus]|nr:DASH complex subunit Ask1-domain-containing protein [Lactarius deliciosus]
MPKNIRELKPIPPNPPRWEPSTDPSSIAIPGLDATASVNDQIDQIDQLITLKLQDIDANFSKMQQVLSNRILPAVKRFAIGTEPVREAAKFWTSFFEHAAQVHIPTSDHLSSMQEPSSTSSDAHDVAIYPRQLSPPPQAPQPLRAPKPQTAPSSPPSQSIADPSWSALVESPLVRLDRELREFTRADPQPASTSTDTDTDTDPPTPTRTPHYYEEDEPTLPVGMSPPVMLPFARLPTLGRSPAKSAAAHIRHTLVRDALRDCGRRHQYRELRRALAALALALYARRERDLMRRVSLFPRVSSVPSSSTDRARGGVPHDASRSLGRGGGSGRDARERRRVRVRFLVFGGGGLGAQHGAPERLRSCSRRDSAGVTTTTITTTDEDDSLDADPDAATASFEPVHPFARVVAAGAEDDSFDSLDGDAPEETVFGARPVKRGAALPLGT